LNEAWERTLRLGIVHAMAYPSAVPGEKSYLDTLNKLAQDNFFSVLEIVWVKDAAIRKTIKRMMESARVAITYAAQAALLNQKLDLSSPIDHERKKAVSQIKTCIDEAFELGAERMSLLSGFDHGESKRTESMRFFIQSLKEICAYGEQQDMPITLEAFDREVEKKCLIGPAEDAAALATAIRREYSNFGIMYDMAHGPLLDEDPRRALSLLKPFLVHVHVGNCVKRDKGHPAYGDKHPRFGVQGGEHDVPQLTRFMKILFDLGYLRRRQKEGALLPIVGFEIKPMLDEDPDLVVAGSKRVWREAWKRL
jgi:sugar phosphate isomerase/epimerase